ncbi:MAG: diguanylate cyclase, partial [Pseudonocardia sediminis]
MSRPDHPPRTAGDPAAEPELRRALDSAFSNAPIGMAVLAPDGVITVCNPAMGDLLGLAHDDLTGRTFFDVTHPDDLAEAQANCGLMQRGETRILRHECRFLRSDGSVVWVSVTTSRVEPTPGNPAHLIMHIEDIDERKALESALTHQARHDPLTGLANRTLLAERLQQAGGNGRHSRPMCLIYLDLNGFKAVNDRYGHATGDQVLTELAHRIRGVVRPHDTAARLGGDEFAVLCVDTEPHHGPLVAARLRTATSQPFEIGGHRIALSAAVGVSTSAHL